MELEEAFKELEIHCNNFANIGDAKELYRKDKPKFMHYYIKVLQFYSYIMKKPEATLDDFIRAVNLVGDIEINNPSLEEYISILVDINSKSDEKPLQNSKENLKGKIEETVQKLIMMDGYDTEIVEVVKFDLTSYRDILLKNKSSYSEEEFSEQLERIEKNLQIIKQSEHSISEIESKISLM
ncbi:MAG: hypothetical protein R3Y21_01705 [Mycoplasmatota bacterium]